MGEARRRGGYEARRAQPKGTAWRQGPMVTVGVDMAASDEDRQVARTASALRALGLAVAAAPMGYFPSGVRRMG